jgi:hypothetical protein
LRLGLTRGGAKNHFFLFHPQPNSGSSIIRIPLVEFEILCAVLHPSLLNIAKSRVAGWFISKPKIPIWAKFGGA